MANLLHDLTLKFGVEVRYETDTRNDDSPQCYPSVVYLIGGNEGQALQQLAEWKRIDLQPSEARDMKALFDTFRRAFQAKLAATRDQDPDPERGAPTC